MQTKYGKLSADAFVKYRATLINRIWQLLPLKQESCNTLEGNINRLNRELFGMIEVIPDCEAQVLTIINLLENLIAEEDFKAYRSDVLRCCRLMEKINGGDENV